MKDKPAYREAVLLAKDKTHLRSNQQIARYLALLLVPESRQQAGPVMRLADRHAPAITRFFRECDKIGKEPAAFISVDGLPIEVAEHHGQPAILIRGVASGAHQSPLAGFSSVADEAFLPTVRLLHECFSQSDFEYYGMILLFGRVTTGSTHLNHMEPEALVIVAPASDCRRYVQAEISGSDLLRASDFFASTHDMNEKSGVIRAGPNGYAR